MATIPKRPAPKPKWTLPSPTQMALGAMALIISVALAMYYLMNPQRVQVMLFEIDRLALVAWTVFILVAAMSFGAAVLRWLKLRPRGHADTALFGIGIGLFVFGLVTLALGVLGFAGRVRLVVILLAMLGLGLNDLGTLLRMAGIALKRFRGRAGVFRIALWAIVLFFLLMNLTRAFEPPWDYDSLEYHLAAPAAYHDAGRVYFMSRNAYANFPQNMEILYYAAMELTEDPLRGAMLGQMLNAALGVLAAFALRQMLRGFTGAATAELAAAIFYLWPGVTVYSGMAYVELSLMFYGVLAVWALLFSWRRKLTLPGPQGWIILSGIATGIALGVKYTAALLLFVPIVLWLITLGFAARAKLKTIAKRVAIYAGVTLLCFSPWMIRNAVNTGNPVYPLLYGVFGGGNWDAQKAARWTQAHSPKSLSGANMVEQAREVFFFDEGHASLLLFVFVPCILLVRRRERAVSAFLLLHCALLFMLWFVFTQQNARFLEVGAPLLAGLSALGAGAVFRDGAGGARVGIIMLLLFLPERWVNYIEVNRSLGVALGPVSVDEHMTKSAPDYRANYRAMQFLNALPEESRILLLGEAQTFYLRRPYLAATVFDTQPVAELMAGAETSEQVYEAFKSRGVTHIFADSAQLLRLQTSYAYIYKEQRYLGMLDAFNWQLFGEFQQEHLKLVWSMPEKGVDAFNWANWPQVIAAKLSGRDVPSFLAVYEVE